MTEETSEVSGTTDFVFNEHGELVSQTDARGIATLRTVDELDRLTVVDYPTASLDVAYVYDDPLVPFSLGRLTSIARDGASVDCSIRGRFVSMSAPGRSRSTIGCRQPRESLRVILSEEAR